MKRGNRGKKLFIAANAFFWLVLLLKKSQKNSFGDRFSPTPVAEKWCPALYPTCVLMSRVGPYDLACNRLSTSGFPRWAHGTFGVSCRVNCFCGEKQVSPFPDARNWRTEQLGTPISRFHTICGDATAFSSGPTRFSLIRLPRVTV